MSDSTSGDPRRRAPAPDRARRRKIRGRQADTGEPYTEAARRLDQAAADRPAAGPSAEVDWRHVAVQVAHHNGAFQGLTSRERDALEAAMQTEPARGFTAAEPWALADAAELMRTAEPDAPEGHCALSFVHVPHFWGGEDTGRPRAFCTGEEVDEE